MGTLVLSLECIYKLVSNLHLYSKTTAICIVAICCRSDGSYVSPKKKRTRPVQGVRKKGIEPRHKVRSAPTDQHDLDQAPPGKATESGGFEQDDHSAIQSSAGKDCSLQISDCSEQSAPADTRYFE